MPVPHPPTGVAASVSAQVFGTLINLAGRHRMLSQRLVLYAVLAASEAPQGPSLALSREALALFAQSHKHLCQGGDGLPGVFNARIQQLFFGPEGADDPIQAFIQQAHQVLNQIERAHTHRLAARSSEGLAQLVAQATPMLARLNTITQAYEAEAQASERARLSHLQTLIGRIEHVAREARVVSLNARVVAARAGEGGREFAVVAQVLSQVSEQIAHLANEAGMAQAA